MATYVALQATNVAPSPPSSLLKPTAMELDPCKSFVSLETSNIRISQDISGPLGGTPDGSTHHVHVAKACLIAGNGPNKKPIFIPGVSKIRIFLAWLQVSCSCGLIAHRKGEKLLVVPSTTDGFRAAVGALRSLDGKDGVSSHTFILPKESCLLFLVKKPEIVIPEKFVWEELESQYIRVQGNTQLRSGRRD